MNIFVFFVSNKIIFIIGNLVEFSDFGIKGVFNKGLLL